jgi:hypothetical protein
VFLSEASNFFPTSMIKKTVVMSKDFVQYNTDGKNCQPDRNSKKQLKFRPVLLIEEIFCVHFRVQQIRFFIKKIKNTDPVKGAKFKSKNHLQSMFSDFLSRFLCSWLQSLKKCSYDLKNF